jgi:hypothetical protein
MACSQKLLVTFNAIGIFLSSIILIATLVVYFVDIPEVTPYVALVPSYAFQGVISVSAFTLALCVMGIWGVKRKNKFIMGLYVALVLVLMVAEIAICGVVLTTYYEVEGDIGVVGESVSTAIETVEDQLVKFAISSSGTGPWLVIQAGLHCCGFNFRTTFDERIAAAQPGLAQRLYDEKDNLDGLVNGSTLAAFEEYVNQGRDSLMSGIDCTVEGTAAINAIKGSEIEFTAELDITAGLDATVGEESNYFCEDSFFSKVRPYYLFVGLGALFIGLVLLVCVVSACILLCCTQEKEGGFVKNKNKEPEQRDAHDVSGLQYA